MVVIFTDPALGDLKEIKKYISEDSEFYAKKLIDRIIKKAERIKTFPESGHIVPEYNNESIRQVLEGSYRIIYKIHPDHIGVIRVFHSARLLK